MSRRCTKKNLGRLWLAYTKPQGDASLSEAIGSLGSRRNSSVGSLLIKQLAEVYLLTSSDTGDPGVSSEYHLSQLL